VDDAPRGVDTLDDTVDADTVDADTVDSDPADTDILDADTVDSDILDADTDPVDSDAVGTDPVDSDADMVDTDWSETDPPATFPTWRFTGLAHHDLCTTATPCQQDRIVYGRPLQERPAACVRGDHYAPGELTDAVLVCFLDYLRLGVHGAIRVLDPAARTWTDLPGGGPRDFVTAGLLDRAGASQIGSLRFVQLDPADNGAALIVRGPNGPLMRRGADGVWRRDAAFGAAWEGAGFLRTSEPLVVDLDDNGLLDIGMMRCGLDDRCEPVVFYQLLPGVWQASANVTRLAGRSSDAYAWDAVRHPDTGLWTLVAAGDRISAALSGASGVFVQSGTGPDGFPAFTEAAGTTAAAQAGMGVMHLDLRGIDAFGASTPVPDGVDEIILSTQVQCPEVLQELLPGLGIDRWTELTNSISNWIVQGGRFRPGCWEDPTPETEDLAWGVSLVAPDLLLVAQGDDGRVLPTGQCARPECPQDGEPMTGWLPWHGRLWAYPLDHLQFVSPDGDDLRNGNRRTVEVHEVAGVTVVVTGGTWENGDPEVWVVER
jgi:hypothetical protein